MRVGGPVAPERGQTASVPGPYASWRTDGVRRIASVVFAGIVCGLLSAIMSIGAASLVVASTLSEFVSFLVGITLLSAGVLTLTFALFGSMKGTVATVQAIPCVAAGGVVSATVAGMSAQDGNVFLTAMLAAALSTLIAGVGMILLGVFRLGEIVRYIPFPVIGGFLAGTGWLIFLGGLGIVLAAPASIGIFTTAPEPTALLRLGLAAVFVVVLVVATHRHESPLALPAVVFVAVVIFNVVTFIAGATEADIHAADLIIELPIGRDIWHGFNWRLIGEIYWPAVGTGLLRAPTLLVLATIGLLLNTTAIELKRNEDVNLGRDLRAEGVGNVFSALLGGLPGFKSVAPTLIADHLGANSRWVGLVAAATLLGVLALGNHVLDIFPTFVFGGILIWLGGSLMLEWLVLQSRQIGRWDVAIIVLIFITIVAYGFDVGLLAGLIAAVLLFIYQYSRVDIVRHELTGVEFRSSIAARAGVSQENARRILIVQLSGFLFFGTAHRFRLRIQERLRELGAQGRGFLVVDFRQVTGIDSSSTISFDRLGQTAAASGVTIVLTGLAADARAALLGGRNESEEGEVFHAEPDLESGVRWCEDEQLAADGIFAREVRSLDSALAELIEDRAAVNTVSQYCERSVVASGAALAEQGMASSDIYFIESGNASIDIADDRGRRVYVATVGPGDFVGEIAFYLDDRRSASVTAKDEMVVWRLSSEAMQRLQAEEPESALKFHRGMAALLSRRLVSTSRHISIFAG